LKRTPEPDRTLDTLRVEFAARQASLNRLLDRFEAFGRAKRIPAAIQRDVHLALDEIVSNIIRHGSGVKPSCRIRVDVTFDGGVVSVEVVDNGRPFDPVGAATPRARGSVLKRPSGGLGIRLVKGVMEEMEYSRQRGANRLRMKRGVKSRRR
jgi:serine/threonine-protein kinase RsbW